MKQPVELRLAAILAADVAGYSRLMGADEEGPRTRIACHIGDKDRGKTEDQVVVS